MIIIELKTEAGWRKRTTTTHSSSSFKYPKKKLLLTLMYMHRYNVHDIFWRLLYNFH